MSDLGFKTTLNLSYEAALEKVTEALKAEGFGILTNIDVKETMKKKMDFIKEPALQPVAREARKKLERVTQTLRNL